MSTLECSEIWRILYNFVVVELLVNITRMYPNFVTNFLFMNTFRGETMEI